MKLFHHIIVLFTSEQEKADFLEAGVVFKNITRGSRGECVEIDIGDEDPRWGSVAALLASLEGNEQVEKRCAGPPHDRALGREHTADERTRCRTYKVATRAQVAGRVFWSKRGRATLA